jgi:hypothetical protein
MLHEHARFEKEFVGDLYFETNVGAVALLFLIALSVNWQKLVAAFRELVLTSRHQWVNHLKAAIWAMVALSFVLTVNWNFDYVISVAFGSMDATAILLVAVFGLSALGKVDWRIAVIIAAVIVVSEDLTGPLYDWIEATAETDGMSTDRLELGEIVVTGQVIGPGGYFVSVSALFSLVTTLCVGLLGAAVAPCWQSKNPETLKTSRTLGYVIAAVCVAFAAVPIGFTRFEYIHYLVLLVAGLLMGYRWRYQAIVLAPLVLVFAFLSIGFAFARSPGDVPSALRAIDICFVAFPATFIGVLLNRYRPASSAILNTGEA